MVKRNPNLIDMLNLLENPIIKESVETCLEVGENGRVQRNCKSSTSDYIFLAGDIANGHDAQVILSPCSDDYRKVDILGYRDYELDGQDVRGAFYANRTHQGFRDWARFVGEYCRQKGIKYSNHGGTVEEFVNKITQNIWGEVIFQLELPYQQQKQMEKKIHDLEQERDTLQLLGL